MAGETTHQIKKGRVHSHTSRFFDAVLEKISHEGMILGIIRKTHSSKGRSIKL
jgi:hypothetical protein